MPYQYRKKGNEEQASFNMYVDEELAKAQLDLSEPGASLAFERTQIALERGRCLIQKSTRIVEYSELG